MGGESLLVRVQGWEKFSTHIPCAQGCQQLLYVLDFLKIEFLDSQLI